MSLKKTFLYVGIPLLIISTLLFIFLLIIALQSKTAIDDVKGYNPEREKPRPNVLPPTRNIENQENTAGLYSNVLEKKDWTFMVYMTADNNLDQAGLDDLNEMEMAGSSEAVNVIALLDRQGQDNTSLYYVSKDNSDSPVIISPNIDSSPFSSELNMGNPENLASFVQWTTSNYPAQHYVLVLWGHGLGWKGIGFDENNGNDQITPVELKLALTNIKESIGFPLDIVAFDACLMQMIELASAIGESDSSSYIIGSQESVPGPGWNYQKVIAILDSDPEIEPAMIAEGITRLYLSQYPKENITLSALQSSSIQELSAQMNAMADSLILSQDWTGITRARLETEQFNESSYVDLYDFVTKIQKSVYNATVQKTVESIPGSIQRVVVSNRTNSTHPNAKGVSIYFPTSGDFDGSYSNTTLNTSRWKYFLTKYLETTRKTEAQR